VSNSKYRFGFDGATLSLVDVIGHGATLSLEAPMRTNIILDDDRVAEATELTGIKTKKALVNEALRVLIDVRRRRNLLELEGKIRFADGYDHKINR